MPAAALLIALCGYFAGAYGVLASRRYSFAGLVPLVWIAMSDATGPAALAVQALACGWLLAMVLIAFRPDLGEAPRSAIATMVTAIRCRQPSTCCLLVGFVVELLWIMQGTHPNNMSTPPRGGHVESERMSGRDRMIAGLAGATSVDTALWREQVVLSDVHELERQVRGIATRGELNNTTPIEFDDPETRSRWTFESPAHAFEGTGIADGQRVGELGMGDGKTAFDAIAAPAGALPGMAKGDATIIAGHTLYHYLSAARRIVPRASVPADEWLLGTTPIGGSLAALTDRAVYLFDGRHLLDSDTPPLPRYRVPIPGAPGDLYTAEMVELVDGYLVSFNFTQRAHTMLGALPYQTVLWVDDAGRVTPVATRMLREDFPTFYRYKSWWASPVMYTARAMATGLFAAHDPLAETAVPPIPASVSALAVALALLSLCLGGWFAWHRESSLPARVAWTLACGFVGIPRWSASCSSFRVARTSWTRRSAPFRLPDARKEKMMTTFRVWLGALGALVLATPSFAADETFRQALRTERERPRAIRFERDAFLVRPAITDVTLSPDGKRLAFIRGVDDKRGLWLATTADGAEKQVLASTDATGLAWTRDGRWLLVVSARRLFAVAAAGQGGSRLLANLGGAEERCFHGCRSGEGRRGDRARTFAGGDEFDEVMAARAFRCRRPS